MRLKEKGVARVVYESFEVVEEYVKHGMRRFKVRVKGTNLVFDVRADSVEEALKKAEEMAKKLRKISESSS
ncbi:MAG: hypothetical protein QXP48_05425 [Acidilobaceae archaeon]